MSDGEEVRITSQAGSSTVPILLNEDIRVGVVSLPNGWGHKGGSLSRSNKIGGVNSNELTSHDDVEALAGMSILNGVPFRMTRLVT